MPSLYQAAFRHSVGVKNSYSSCSGFHSTSSNLSWLFNCGTNGARYQWFSSRLFVGRSLSVHMMISELKRMLSGGAIDQWGMQPDYVRLRVTKSRRCELPLLFFRNGADPEPLSRCFHERKQHDEPKPTRPAESSAGSEARSATRRRPETGPAESGPRQGS